jgi:hypothetical protein
MRYELGSYIPEDYILHSHRRENLRSHLVLSNFKNVVISNYLEFWMMGNFRNPSDSDLALQFKR